MRHHNHEDPSADVGVPPNLDKAADDYCCRFRDKMLKDGARMGTYRFACTLMRQAVQGLTRCDPPASLRDTHVEHHPGFQHGRQQVGNHRRWLGGKGFEY